MPSSDKEKKIKEMKKLAASAKKALGKSKKVKSDVKKAHKTGELAKQQLSKEDD